MLHVVIRWVGINVLEECSAYIFYAEMQAVRSSNTLMPTNYIMEFNTEDSKMNIQCYETSEPIYKVFS
jgi:hypothetical protein